MYTSIQQIDSKFANLGDNGDEMSVRVKFTLRNEDTVDEFELVNNSLKFDLYI